MKYTIGIKEVWQKYLEIEANSVAEAKDEAERMLDNYSVWSVDDTPETEITFEG